MSNPSSTIGTPKPSDPNYSSKVRVIVRVRPFLASEILAKSGNPISSCVSFINPELGFRGEVAVYLKDQETSRKECYKVDSFYGQDSCVSQIFNNEVAPLIPGIFYGCNATIFAYGATGSGKTHTMQGTDEIAGIMPLAVSTVLKMCENFLCFVEISYYEVYMDRCYDLLEPKAKEIAVLDDKDGHVQLKGLSRVSVSSMPEFYDVFDCGIQRRKVAHTGLNDVSSRSHGVLVITVSTPSGDGSVPTVTGKLNLIDLAGNEDNRRTCNEGVRLQESAKINQSLFALSNVIYALNNNQPRVPYRESKLTRILQDSLGGNSHALMIACLNPGEYQESLNTVSLASRSRQIRNYVSSAQKEDTPKAKVDMEAKLRAWLESKGKTKSAKRIGGFGSPMMSKTPNSTRSTKKQNSCQTSKKENSKTTIDQGLAHAETRNSFISGAPVVSSVEHKESNAFKDGPKVCVDDRDNEVVVSCVDDHFISQDDGARDSKDASLNDQWVNPTCQSRNDFNETGEFQEEMTTTGATGIPESATSLFDQSLNNEKLACTPCTDLARSPPISEKIRSLQKSLRKVLSPINSNTNSRQFEDPRSEDQICLVFLEPNTSKTPYVVKCDSERFEAATNPFDKFNSQSSNLKNSLVQEYLAFLNSASKEDLLKLKGIGHKRAESILHLRETTPLASLYDLEKIGLSSKQVNDIFRRAAREIFG